VIKSAKGSNYKVTFAALVIGAVAFALLRSMVLPGLPAESGYTRGFAFLAAITVVAAAAALLIPKSGIAAAHRLTTPISTMPSWPSWPVARSPMCDVPERAKETAVRLDGRGLIVTRAARPLALGSERQ